MSRVNTKERIIEAALELFMELGYQKTSIARIEKAAGLAPRAGAFYRHFDSKQTLLAEIARTRLSETPEQFGFAQLADFSDTRAELVAIALKYEETMTRQKPYARLIEEVRLLDFGAELQEDLDTQMMRGLSEWIGTKPGAANLSTEEQIGLLFTIFGGWLFFLSMQQRGAPLEDLRNVVLNEWASRWAGMLDDRTPD